MLSHSLVVHFLLLLLFCVSFTYCSTFNQINTGLPKADASLPNNGGILKAFGDFNSDKAVDSFIVTYQNDTYTLQIYLWMNGGFRLLEGASAIINDTREVTHISPSDFDHDGHMDVLISGRSSDSEDSPFWHTIYFGHLDGFYPNPLVLPPSSTSLFVFDYNNDLYPDMLGLSSDTHVRSIWLNIDPIDKNFRRNFTVVPQPLNVTAISPSTSSSSPLPSLAQNSFTSFIDLNGDCLADLFIVSQASTTSNPPQLYGEIWLNSAVNANHWTLHSVNPFPIGTTTGTFVDVNGNGNVDLLFSVCLPLNTCNDVNELHIVYNNQKSMCSAVFDSTSDTCRSQQDLCSPDDHFYFEKFDMTRVGDANHVIITQQAFGNRHFLVPPPQLSGSYSLSPVYQHSFPQVSLHTGDIDLDGFPDLLIPLYDPQQASKMKDTDALTAYLSSVSTTVWMNVDDGNGGRTFSRRDNTGVESVPGAVVGAMFDFGDSGLLDILLVQFLTSTTSNVVKYSPSVASLSNNLELDAFFLTTTGSNGVCPAWCPSSPGPRFPDPKPYGVNHPGLTFKFTVTDIDGTKHARTANSLSQLGHAYSLQTPYIVNGLGRTYSYVEEFYFGINVKYQKNWQMWVAVVPNSQIIVFPYEPWSPDSWTLELFVSPVSRLKWVVLSVLIALLANAIIIAYLHWQEKKQDAAEIKKHELLFRF